MPYRGRDGGISTRHFDSEGKHGKDAAGGARPDDECQSRDLPPAANEGPERDCEPIWSFFRKKVSAVPKLT